ncbi:hypothetical protein HHI36_012155 [Cryptolaemus montrouzieri]|uniref:Choline transporter-like protein n=1 Tax=Cryptolaemus montrouzieri TaxID=559131 RepID=A0ABD2NEY9_9CUCU
MTCCGEEKEIATETGQPIPHDPHFSGPLKYRSCTDIIFLLLFLTFFGCWIAIGLYAFHNGDPTAILTPKDSNGLRCGVDSSVKDKPYLFFFDLTQCIGPSVPFLGCPTPQVCVTKCPNETFYVTSDPVNPDKLICRDNVPNNRKKPDGIECAKWYLPSVPVQRRCIPILNKQTIDVLNNQIHSSVKTIEDAISNVKLITQTEQVGQNVVDDLMESWKKIAVGLLVSLFVTLVYIMMLRWTAGVMVWVSIIGVIVALSLGTYCSAVKYRDALQQEKNMDPDAESLHSLKKYFWLTALIICSVSLLIILLITIFLRKRISLAIALIEEGSKAISSVTSVFVFPIFPWILQIVVICFAIAVALMLTTTGTPLFKLKKLNSSAQLIYPKCSLELDQICNPDNDTTTTILRDCPDLVCKLIRVVHHKYYDYMHWFNIVGFFWYSFFVSAFGQMVLACVFATWYWTKPRYKLPFFAVTSSTLTVLRYHIGTLAFGSLIITICRMIRLVLEYIDRKLKKYNNEVTRAIMCLLKCFFWCLEKFLKFINTNAYIMCAIHGKNFCTSAREAFMLLMRNILRVFVLDKVTDFLFFISSLLISVGVGILAYLVFATDMTPIDNSNLNYVEVPIAVIVICTYFISTIFFNVYSMAVDTLFLCFLEDCERNDGSPDRPYYMSKDLMKIFGKKNKVE